MNNADQVALYLASCIAATAHDFDKKSAAKGERVRHRKLCETAADVISGRAYPPRASGRHSTYDQKDVVDRLLEMAAVLRRYEE